ncbi:hypothetical protein [Taibaiella koreensis]|uniref:hypothetical protein n=1 Tax=Taibaiella koreensis TaxID=1268548 RepID=UPI000E59CA89|nr:hypothetical protein [Taibaiella koreensis]
MHANSTYRPRFTERRMASLLGLSEEEFSRLSHSGLRDLTDSYGVVYKYYIQFSPNNDKELLERLNLNRSQTVYFTPDQLNG